MLASKIQPDQISARARPAYLKIQRAFFAVCLILGPLLLILSVFFSPDRTVDSNSGSAVIAAYMAAGTAGTSLSPLGFFILVTELFLLPFGALGMTVLAMRRSPWLASIGCFLYITGLMAFSVFVGQRVQSRLMAQMGGGQQLVTLWDRFNTDPVITAYLYIAVIGFFLIGPMLLGIGLGRTGMIPAWAAWALILRAPLQVAGFITHIGLSIEFVTFGLLLIGSIPIALALLKFSDEKGPAPTGEQPSSAI
ncbi:MAG TPA: hypothetical protein VIY29_26130 [Ktedonobacteraceae bacterium]